MEACLSKIEFSTFGLTDTGMVRDHNEDALLLDEGLGLFAVADGMGGHQGGEIASRMAIEILKDGVSRVLAGGALVGAMDRNVSSAANILLSSIRLANLAIFEAAGSNPVWRGMGTTIVALLVSEGRAAIAHVGDSRLYLLRNKKIHQITDDHSMVADQLRKGLISKEEARCSTRKNIITRALGQSADVAIDLHEISLQDGDRLLLCSDGLSGMLLDEEIVALISSRSTPQAACRDLVEQANARGGVDNITALLLFISQTSGLWSRFSRLFQK